MRHFSEFIILNGGAATASGTGNWVAVYDYVEKSLDIRVTGTVSAEIRVSNEPNMPADNTDGVLLQTAITSTTFVDVGVKPIRWLKVKPATITSGSLTVYFSGNRFKRSFQSSP